MEGYEQLIANIWEAGDSSVITIDKRYMTALGLKKGDMLKIWLKKVEKVE